MSSRMKEHLSAVRDDLFPENALRLVPEIALLKLVALKFRANDNSIIEIFGHLIFRDAMQ